MSTKTKQQLLKELQEKEEEIKNLKRKLKEEEITCEFCKKTFLKRFGDNHICRSCPKPIEYNKVCNNCGKTWGSGNYCRGKCGAYDGEYEDGYGR
jgi:hypothetical protein